MASGLRDSAKRVQEFLALKGFSFWVRELPNSTRTSQEAADSIGCTVGQIAKSLVFKERNSGRPVLVIASGANRVDLNKVERATGLVLGRADGKLVKNRTGYAIGCVPPAGHKEPLETLLDPDLLDNETIWAAAGTPFAVFELRAADLEPLTGGTWVDLKEA
jgi:prolyl-tRNA editing enzyme YbaK/EbsC (Cys-tRNA(Pro) deacylase)